MNIGRDTLKQLTLRELKTLIRVAVQKEMEAFNRERYRRQAWLRFELRERTEDELDELYSVPELVRKFPSC